MDRHGALVVDERALVVHEGGEMDLHGPLVVHERGVMDLHGPIVVHLRRSWSMSDPWRSMSGRSKSISLG